MLDYLPRRGVFLEIGGNDGYSQSNTYYLERHRGWSGILIEPQPKLHRIARVLRRRSQCFNYACVADESVTEVTLATNTDDLMAVTLGQQANANEAARIRGGRTIRVPATTISNLVDRAGTPPVDFMSVDVEGAELSVLGGLDLARHAPQWLLVETRYPEVVEELLQSHMTRLAQLSHHDYLWTRN